MTITYHDDLEQGSDEWLEQRLGVLTASEIDLVITKTFKTASNEKTRMHVYTLLSQRITKYVEPQYISDKMLRGHDDEITANELYSERYAQVRSCGFITNDSLGFVMGYSPDGLVGDEGGTEVKSRDPKFQVKTIVEDKVPDEFMPQIQDGLFVSQRKWIDFISYSAGLPIFVKRVFPIVEHQVAIKKAAIAFEQNIKDAMEKYMVNSKGLIETERTVEGDLI